MIAKEQINLEWLEATVMQNKRMDKILLEKVTRAMLLLEALSQSRFEFVFKGGTAVMLLLGQPRQTCLTCIPAPIPTASARVFRSLFSPAPVSTHLRSLATKMPSCADHGAHLAEDPRRSSPPANHCPGSHATRPGTISRTQFHSGL